MLLRDFKFLVKYIYKVRQIEKKVCEYASKICFEKRLTVQ